MLIEEEAMALRTGSNIRIKELKCEINVCWTEKLECGINTPVFFG